MVEILNLIRDAIKLSYDEELDVKLYKTKKKEFGDLYTNVAIKLSRSINEDPIAIADNIILNMKYNDDDFTVYNNNGYINITLKNYFSTIMDTIVSNNNLNIQDIGNGRLILVLLNNISLYDDINFNTMRSFVYMKALINILKFANFNVHSECFLKNNKQLAIKIAQSVIYEVARQSLLNENGNLQDADSITDDLKREFILDIDKHSTYINRDFIQKIITKIINTEDEEFVTLPIKMQVEECIGIIEQYVFNKLYRICGQFSIKGDMTDSYEFSNKLLKNKVIDEVIKILLDDNLAYTKPDGSIWYSSRNVDAHRCLVLEDGSYTDTLYDIAYIYHVLRKYKPDHIISIYDESYSCKKLMFDNNLIVNKQLLDQILVSYSEFDSTLNLLYKDIVSSTELRDMNGHPNFSFIYNNLFDNRRNCKSYLYESLSTNKNKKFSINFTNTRGGSTKNNYIYITTCRIFNVLERGGFKVYKHEITDTTDIAYSNLNKKERELVLELYNFPEVIHKCVTTFEPAYLAKYVYKLAKLFNRFFAVTKILYDDPGVRKRRLYICQETYKIIQKSTKLLGCDI